MAASSKQQNQGRSWPGWKDYSSYGKSYSSAAKGASDKGKPKKKTNQYVGCMVCEGDWAWVGSKKYHCTKCWKPFPTPKEWRSHCNKIKDDEEGEDEDDDEDDDGCDGTNFTDLQMIHKQVGPLSGHIVQTILTQAGGATVEAHVLKKVLALLSSEAKKGTSTTQQPYIEPTKKYDILLHKKKLLAKERSRMDNTKKQQAEKLVRLEKEIVDLRASIADLCAKSRKSIAEESAIDHDLSLEFPDGRPIERVKPDPPEVPPGQGQEGMEVDFEELSEFTDTMSEPGTAVDAEQVQLHSQVQQLHDAAKAAHEERAQNQLELTRIRELHKNAEASFAHVSKKFIDTKTAAKHGKSKVKYNKVTAQAVKTADAKAAAGKKEAAEVMLGAPQLAELDNPHASPLSPSDDPAAASGTATPTGGPQA